MLTTGQEGRNMCPIFSDFLHFVARFIRYDETEGGIIGGDCLLEACGSALSVPEHRKR